MQPRPGDGTAVPAADMLDGVAIAPSDFSPWPQARISGLLPTDSTPQLDRAQKLAKW